MANTEIKHSTDLGGLVPLEGWYCVDDDGECFGPFTTKAEAEVFGVALAARDGERNFPFSGSF